MNCRTVFVLCIAFLMAINSCSYEEENQPPVLRIAHAPHDHHAPLYISAMNPDYFKSNCGVYLNEIEFKKQYELIADNRKLATVQIDSSTGGVKLIRRLSENLADLSFGGIPAMLSFIDQGDPLHILLPVNGEGAGLVMGKDFPGRSWADFITYVKKSEKPIRIGYKIAVSVQNLIFESALTAEHITYSLPESPDEWSAQVQLINLHGPKNLIPALENKLIDGFVIMQPFLALAEAKGVGKTVAQLNELPPQGEWKGNPCCAVAANDSYVKKHTEAVEALLILLYRANIFIRSHPEQSARQVAKWLGTSFEVEQLSLPTIAFTTDFDEDWNKGVDFWVEQMVKAGELNNIVKVAYEKGDLAREIYDFSIYEKVKTKALTLSNQ